MCVDTWLNIQMLFFPKFLAHKCLQCLLFAVELGFYIYIFTFTIYIYDFLSPELRGFNVLH